MRAEQLAFMQSACVCRLSRDDTCAGSQPQFLSLRTGGGAERSSALVCLSYSLSYWGVFLHLWRWGHQQSSCTRAINMLEVFCTLWLISSAYPFAYTDDATYKFGRSIRNSRKNMSNYVKFVGSYLYLTFLSWYTGNDRVIKPRVCDVAGTHINLLCRKAGERSSRSVIFKNLCNFCKTILSNKDVYTGRTREVL